MDVINHNQINKRVKVDACIADEIQYLNDQGVVTLGCCCGHGKSGQIVEWENGFGKWKGHESPPIALISQSSVAKGKELGYTAYPYYYADGEHNDTWQMILKSGCITEDDCRNWHKENGLPFEKGLNIIGNRGAETPLPV
ncbi:hypothetical protein [Cohnella kolymensis]|uniref:hypothetical protein n=1 Tax=Cohnella kolymensis TaxID=1590652 RepID=UPI00126A5B03|nr:hypothetical protein [Cohnella kolymensis]